MYPTKIGIAKRIHSAFLLNRKNIYLSITLQIIDKGLSYATPFFLLYGFQNEYVYNEYEYILSISVLLLTFSDLGLRNYIVYAGFKKKTKNVSDRIYSTQVLLSLIGLLLISISYILTLCYQEIEIYWTLILTHVLAWTLIGVLSQLFILKDYPALYVSISIVSKASVAFFLALIYAFDYTFNITDLFLVQGLIIVIFLGIAFTKNKINIDLCDGYIFIHESVKFAWPLLLGGFFSLSVLNVSKIYVYDNLSEQDVTSFYFWSRIVMLVQLTHLGLVPLLLKRIYSMEFVEIFRSLVFKRYMFIMFLVTAVIFVVFSITNGVESKRIPQIEVLSLGCYLLYTLLWCYTAFLESVYISNDKNIFLMCVAGLALFFYVLMIYIYDIHSLQDMLVVMNWTIILQAVLVTVGIRRFNKTKSYPNS